jgi:hypothetical protein
MGRAVVSTQATHLRLAATVIRTADDFARAYMQLGRPIDPLTETRVHVYRADSNAEFYLDPADRAKLDACRYAGMRYVVTRVVPVAEAEDNGLVVSLECSWCDGSGQVFASGDDAIEAGRGDLTYDDGAGWNFLGTCPDCAAQHNEEEKVGG